MKSQEEGRFLFGISLTDKPKWKQFLICSSGFFFGYLVNGICEEYVYNKLQFSYGWYFTFIQGFVYLLLIHLQGFTAKQMVNPWKTYVKLSAVLMGSNGLTKGSLAFLNYPAQLMFKSTKVLPVMIMGAFIPGLRRKYPVHEYISALLLVVGLILFTLADAQTSPNFSAVGVIMVSGALIMDAFLGNLQEAIFTMNPQTTQMEMLFCSTVVGLPFLIPPMLLTGELFIAWTSCSQHLYVYGVLAFEAMATYIGQVSVLSLIALFGAATTAMMRGRESRIQYWSSIERRERNWDEEDDKIFQLDEEDLSIEWSYSIRVRSPYLLTCLKINLIILIFHGPFLAVFWTHLNQNLILFNFKFESSFLFVF